MTQPGHQELVAALNELLEQSRSGVSVVQVYLRGTTDEEVRRGLKEAIVSQARICSTLYLHIQELGGEPSTQVASPAGQAPTPADPGMQAEALVRLLERFIGSVEGHLALMDAFSRDFFGQALTEQRRHLTWVRSVAMRYNL